MNLLDCIKFATENPFASLATIDGGQPRVRTLQLDHADETGFYFTVLKSKEVYRQLIENQRVEVCFYNHSADPMTMKQMRAVGVAEPSDNQMVTQKALQSRAPLAQVLGVSPDDMAGMAAVFRIHGGEIHFWTVMDIGRERELERVRF